MKKIVAISVMFALVAAAAFAQPTVGGQLKAGATLLKGTNEKDIKQDKVYEAGQDLGTTAATIGAENEKWGEVGKDFTAGQRTTDAWLNFGFGDAEMGGKVRANARSAGDYYSPRAFAFMWWQPNQYFKIQAGSNPDGDWGSAQITGWGFNNEAQDFVALDKDSGDMGGNTVWVARNAGFYGGISSGAILTSLFPMDGLTINIGFPWAETSDRALDKWLRFHLQAKYDLEEIGSIRFTYEGQGQAQKQIPDSYLAFSADAVQNDVIWGNDKLNEKVWLETLDSANFGATKGQTDAYGDPVYGIESPKLWLSFFSNKLVDGLAFDVGFGYQPKLQSGNTPPLSIGLGVAYTAEDFGAKVRVGALLAGKNRGVFTAQEWERVTFDQKESQYIDGKYKDMSDSGKIKDVKKDEWQKARISKDDNLYDEWSTGTEIAVNILPYYKLSAFTFYLGAGLGIKLLPTDEGNPNRKFSDEEVSKRYKDYLNGSKQFAQNDTDNRYTAAEAGDRTDKIGQLKSDKFYVPEATSTEITWYVNPYIRKSVNGANFMFGVKLWSNGTVKNPGTKEWVQSTDKDGKVTGGTYEYTLNGTTPPVKKTFASTWSSNINWAIPIGVNVYF